MKHPTLTVLIATIGKAGLRKCLHSLKSQDWLPGDEVLVVSDGPSLARECFRLTGLPGRAIEIDGPNRDWGHTPRNQCMKLAQGDFILHMDDDDMYYPWSFRQMRETLAKNPKSPHMFRLRYKGGNHVLWTQPMVAYGNVSTQLIVHPNNGKWGKWQPWYGGDFDFIRKTEMLNVNPFVWVDQVICEKAPPDRPLMYGTDWNGHRVRQHPDDELPPPAPTIAWPTRARPIQDATPLKSFTTTWNVGTLSLTA
jgi:hypothetical protein